MSNFCPVCAQVLIAPGFQCPRCGWGATGSRNQRAAPRPAYSPSPFGQRSGGLTPSGYSTANSMFMFAKGIPIWGCVIVGMFFHLPAIVLLVLYFGNYPSHDRQRFGATLLGFAGSILLGFLFLISAFLLSQFK